MKQKHLALTLGALILSTVLLLVSCKKINEATTLGGDLLPVIDNINTFDTSLTVEAYNDIFTITNDSTRASYGTEQFLGLITNDPFFGKTDARMFFELKPSGYPFAFANKPHPDSLMIDSVVMVLDYVGTYGDTTVPQTINVYEMDQSGETFRADTGYLIRQNNFTYSNLLGSATIVPSALNDSVKAFQDTTAFQMRIRLANSFGQRLLMYDSVAGSSNNAYQNDSIFKTKFKGFALQSVNGGNAVMGFSLTNANTKLAIYYRYTHGTPNLDLDTTVAYFIFKDYDNYQQIASANANYIQRDYSGTPVQAAQGGTTPAPYAYIQNAPGTYAKLKIPGLAAMNNRIVHRAELIMEQAYDVSDTMFGPPLLYLDAFDPTLNAYKMIPFDVLFSSTGALNLGSFGTSPYNTTDPGGHSVKQWRFNVSRYVQNVVNKVERPYDLRLTAPFYLDEYYQPTPATTASKQRATVNTNTTVGRVRLYGGDPTLSNPQRMRLRVVYSKI